MMMLTEAPLAPPLNRLFEEADVAEPQIDAAFADLSDDEQARMLRSKTDYGEVYGRMKHLPLPVSRETGALLYMLARSTKARTIVEFGTSFGISTLHLAAALRDNGGGALSPASSSPPRRRAPATTSRRVASSIWSRSARDAERRFAWRDRPRSPRRRQGALPRNSEPPREPSRPGALVVADNADVSPDYLSRVRSQASGYMSVPFAEDVELSMRIG